MNPIDKIINQQYTHLHKCDVCKREVNTCDIYMYRRFNWEAIMCWNDEPVEFNQPICFSCVDKIENEDCECGNVKAPDAVACRHCYSMKHNRVCMCIKCIDDKCDNQDSLVNKGKHSFNSADSQVIKVEVLRHKGTHIFMQCCEYCLRVKQRRIDIDSRKDASLILKLIKDKVKGWETLGNFSEQQLQASNPYSEYKDLEDGYVEEVWK